VSAASTNHTVRVPASDLPHNARSLST
jgi:hypothetical protein